MKLCNIRASTSERLQTTTPKPRNMFCCLKEHTNLLVFKFVQIVTGDDQSFTFYEKELIIHLLCTGTVPKTVNNSPHQIPIQ